MLAGRFITPLGDGAAMPAEGFSKSCKKIKIKIYIYNTLAIETSRERRKNKESGGRGRNKGGSERKQMNASVGDAAEGKK